MRKLIVLPALLLLLAASTSTVAAAPPTHEPTGNPPVSEFEAGVLCDFAVRFDVVSDKEITHTFTDADGNVTFSLVTGRLWVEVTNVETGESMVVKVSGPGRFVPQEDGSLIITGGGHWLLFATATDPGGPGMWYTTGPVGVSIGPDGLPASFDIGRDAVDLCEALAG